ncbi:secretory phospholipase A2 receptor-like [Fundulus heteroclitus]|uniref:secretory phospholipase A2 receptor-like n=1 Tax=Fundulus heteroclitus TaxID=8078 RepID=UPI00165A5635|nr:secretory phospholipase A2 receptor-like [Fundulus heteroclitus]
MDCGSYHYFICKDDKTKYTFIPKAKKWSEAQQYCQDNDKDLANIESSDLYTTVNEEDFPVWIGLHRDGGSWNWSAGHSEYKKWKSKEPSSEGDCVSISSERKEMAVQNCSAYSPFLCVSDNVFLVKKEKSWEEALEYCRGLRSSTNSNLRFDLISLQPGEEHVYMMNKVMEADTDEVWTSLSFLAGEWLWVNGADMRHTDLPSCPAPQQYCGALSKHDTGRIKTRDCSQKKNFLCFWV